MQLHWSRQAVSSPTSAGGSDFMWEFGDSCFSAPEVGMVQTTKPGWSAAVKNNKVLILRDQDLCMRLLIGMPLVRVSSVCSWNEGTQLQLGQTEALTCI